MNRINKAMSVMSLIIVAKNIFPTTAVFPEIRQNRMLAPPGGLAPPIMGNPEFAPANVA